MLFIDFEEFDYIVRILLKSLVHVPRRSLPGPFGRTSSVLGVGGSSPVVLNKVPFFSVF